MAESIAATDLAAEVRGADGTVSVTLWARWEAPAAVLTASTPQQRAFLAQLLRNVARSVETVDPGAED